MATNLQFPIAVHIMTSLGFRQDQDTTSAMLAKSINTSPSFIRRTLAQLSKAQLVRTTKGPKGACKLARGASQISLLDIYKAVDPPRAFSIHRYTSQKACPVSCNIKVVLEEVLAATQSELEKSLAEVNVAELVKKIRQI